MTKKDWTAKQVIIYNALMTGASLSQVANQTKSSYSAVSKIKKIMDAGEIPPAEMLKQEKEISKAQTKFEKEIASSEKMGQTGNASKFTPEKRVPPDNSDYIKLFSDYYDKQIEIIDKTPRYGERYMTGSPTVKVTEITKPEPPRLEMPVDEIEQVEGEVVEEAETGDEHGRKEVSTSCIACSRSHLVTTAAALEEGLRFAREGGTTHPEAVKRIDIAEKEVNIMERIDLSPQAILNSPQREQELARGFMPKIRKLRQDIGQISSVEQMEEAAREASILSQEFRLRQMEMAGANLNPILALAKAVENGEMSIEEARAKVKEYLPSEK